MSLERGYGLKKGCGVLKGTSESFSMWWTLDRVPVAQDQETEAAGIRKEHPWQGQAWPRATHSETPLHTHLVLPSPHALLSFG